MVEEPTEELLKLQPKPGFVAQSLERMEANGYDFGDGDGDDDVEAGAWCLYAPHSSCCWANERMKKEARRQSIKGMQTRADDNLGTIRRLVTEPSSCLVLSMDVCLVRGVCETRESARKSQG